MPQPDVQTSDPVATLPSLNLAPVRGLVNLDQYFGLWGVEETRFCQMVQQVARMDLRLHVQRHAEDGEANAAARVERYPTADARTIQLIDISGTMTKQGSSLSGAGSTVQIRRAIRAAGRDPDVAAVLIRADTPGGTIAGVGDLASDIRNIRESKPVWGFVEDLCASAGYWALSQCEQVFANHATAAIGSIGVYMGLYDLSGFATKEGIKPVVIKTGQLKATGFPGTEISDEQRAYLQEIVDATQAEFTASVAAGRGRKPDQVSQEWVTGRVYDAKQAQSMGLIDGIQSLETTLSQLAAAAAKPRSQRKAVAMSEATSAAGAATSTGATTATAATTTPAAPQAATYQQIVSGCKGIDVAQNGDDSRFVCDQLQRGATLEQARDAWAETLAARVATRDEELKATSTQKGGGQGVKGLNDGDRKDASTQASAGDAVAAWKDLVAGYQKDGASKAEATRRAVKEHPEAHQAYLEAYNASHSTAAQVRRQSAA